MRNRSPQLLIQQVIVVSRISNLSSGTTLEEMKIQEKWQVYGIRKHKHGSIRSKTKKDKLVLDTSLYIDN